MQGARAEQTPLETTQVSASGKPQGDLSSVPRLRPKPPHEAQPQTFASDVLRVATGTGSAQIIGILAAPLIARLFAPAAFGTLALFGSIGSVIAVGSTLRYELSIYLPQEDEDAAKAVGLCITLLLAATALTTLLVLTVGKPMLRLAHVPTLLPYLWFLPLNVFLSGLNNVLGCWNMRKRYFGRVTVLQVINRLVITVSQIALGFAGLVSGGALIATALFGTLVSVSILAYLTLRSSARLFLRTLSVGYLWSTFRRYSKFPRFSLPAVLMNTVSWQLPVILLASLFSVRVTGQYSFANRLIRVPANLIGNSFYRAFFPRAAESRQAGQLGVLVDRALRYLVLLSVFPCCLLMMTAKDLFIVIFGSNWAPAGLYTQILSGWLMFWFISSPLATVFSVLERQDLDLRFQTANIITRVGSLLIGGMLHSSVLAITLFALSGVFVYGAYCLAVISKSGASVSQFIRVIAWNALVFLPAGAIIIVLKFMRAGHFTILIVAAVLLLAYCSHLVRSDAVAKRLASKFLRPFMAES